MAFLTVAGATIPVARNSASADTEEIGDSDRAFDGTMRQTIRNRVTQWRGETIALTRADASSVLSTLNTSTQPQTCAGDLLATISTAVSCFTKAVTETPLQSGSTARYVVSWQLDESS